VPPQVPFSKLPSADLTVGAVYEAGAQKTIQGEPLHRLLPGVGNQGGFRAAGSVKKGSVRYAVLFTSGEDPDWPDGLEDETGVFIYFGDNKSPGAELHATTRSGNSLLKACFDALHGQPPARDLIPPFFVFTKATAGGGRSVKFLGLAIPGAAGIPPGNDLVAIWRTAEGERFQNYRAAFTILDVGTIPRAWIDDLAAGQTLGPACPKAFQVFVQKGKYTPLRAPRTRHWRTPAEQQPTSEGDAALVAAVYDYFKDDPYAFEACAIELWRMLAKEAVTFIEGTRRSVDGGRDAIGRYTLGPKGDQIHLDFSLEAKCYAPGKQANVRDTNRLISRLRHRQFGVFVTTAAVGRQAYEELREDGHPVIVISGHDIADLLKQQGYGTAAAVKTWLAANFPAST